MREQTKLNSWYEKEYYYYCLNIKELNSSAVRTWGRPLKCEMDLFNSQN